MYQRNYNHYDKEQHYIKVMRKAGIFNGVEKIIEIRP